MQNISFTTQSFTRPAKSLQSCPTLCNPIDGSPLGSSVPGILQARILEWVAISFSNAWKWKVKVKSLSRARLLATPWTAAYQAPPSMGFSRQEYWSRVALPSPRNSKILNKRWNKQTCWLKLNISTIHYKSFSKHSRKYNLVWEFSKNPRNTLLFLRLNHTLQNGLPSSGLLK